ncbi:MAG: C39 family peptidase [Patescibacteria group bacterium]
MKWTAVIALSILLGIVVAYRLSLPIPEDSFYRIDRTDKSHTVDRLDIIGETKRTDKTDRSYKANINSDKADGTNKSDTADMIDKTEREDRSDNVVLPVPFQPQAPFGDWREPWGEACEEAALALANRFAHHMETLTQEEMRDEILKLVSYQKEQYGDYRDSDAERTAEIGRQVYGIGVEVKEVKGVEEVKEILKGGNLVIAPMAGRLLKNPYFRQPGPWYHMIVVRGFDDEKQEFITNDVGTRRGEGYRYPYEVIWNAIHDFPGEKEKIEEGEKKIIVITSRTSQ